MTEPKTQFTPGPWHSLPSPYGKKYRYVQIGKEEGYTTAELLPEDAYLIAAAPELYEALDALAENDFGSNGWGPHLERIAIAARSALAKARGEG